MEIKGTQIEEKMSGRTSRLPDETISFNPSSVDDLGLLISKFGPEGLYEISLKLQQVALDDTERGVSQ